MEIFSAKSFELLNIADFWASESKKIERWILWLKRKLWNFPNFQSAPFFVDNTLFCDVTFSENSRCDVKKQMNRIIELSRNFDNLLRNWEINSDSTVNKFWILEQNCQSLSIESNDVVKTGSTNSAKAVNFQQRVREPVNFWCYKYTRKILICQFCLIFKWLCCWKWSKNSQVWP